MSDPIDRIREALAAGPTPGDWDADFASAMRNGSPAVVEYFVRRDGDDISIAADIVNPSSGTPSSVNANYIAACSPDAIRALLDRLDAAERERDSKAAELANLQVAFSDWKVFHSTARLEAENERLRARVVSLEGGLDAALEFASTVAGSSSWWDEVWSEHSSAIDAARRKHG